MVNLDKYLQIKQLSKLAVGGGSRHYRSTVQVLTNQSLRELQLDNQDYKRSSYKVLNCCGHHGCHPNFTLPIML